MDQQQWQEFLSGQGADWHEGAAEFAGTDNAIGLQLADLSPLGAIAITGPDSQKFLQGQLSCDLVGLPDEHLTLGSHCNPKGRMISAFHALKLDQNEFILLMPRDLVSPALAALKKYAVFFKAELTDISESFRWFGLIGRDAGARASHLLSLSHSEHTDLVPGQLRPFDHNGHRALACMLHEQLVAILIPGEQAADLWQQLSASPATAAGFSVWQQQMIGAGIPQLFAASSEMFIPQMLNLQVLGGVNFKKGCYTGQEVVARMQYLGSAKRRMYRVRLDAGKQPHAGDEIFSAEGGSSIGNVVVAARHTDPAQEACIDALAVLTKAKVVAGETLQLGDGRVLELLELPYDADADPLA